MKIYTRVYFIAILNVITQILKNDSHNTVIPLDICIDKLELGKMYPCKSNIKLIIAVSFNILYFLR